MVAPYGGAVYIADTSAWAHARSPAVTGDWNEAVANGQIATCPIVAIELLHSTRSGAEYGRRSGDLAYLRDIPVTRSVTNAALSAYRQLARHHPLAHRRVRMPDLLIAAAAQDAALGVLHYDPDFDVLATVLAFESRWIAPPGSL